MSKNKKNKSKPSIFLFERLAQSLLYSNPRILPSPYSSVKETGEFCVRHEYKQKLGGLIGAMKSGLTEKQRRFCTNILLNHKSAFQTIGLDIIAVSKIAQWQGPLRPPVPTDWIISSTSTQFEIQFPYCNELHLQLSNFKSNEFFETNLNRNRTTSKWTIPTDQTGLMLVSMLKSTYPQFQISDEIQTQLSTIPVSTPNKLPRIGLEDSQLKFYNTTNNHTSYIDDILKLPNRYHQISEFAKLAFYFDDAVSAYLPNSTQVQWQIASNLECQLEKQPHCIFGILEFLKNFDSWPVVVVLDPTFDFANYIGKSFMQTFGKESLASIEKFDNWTKKFWIDNKASQVKLITLDQTTELNEWDFKDGEDYSVDTETIFEFEIVPKLIIDCGTKIKTEYTAYKRLKDEFPLVKRILLS